MVHRDDSGHQRGAIQRRPRTAGRGNPTRFLRAIAALGVLVATACGGGSSSPASSSSPAAPQTPAIQPATSQSDAASTSPMMRSLPETAGSWSRKGAPQRYGPDDLWEYIDGGADQYLSYGFQEVVTAKYSNPAGATATVDVYRMDEPVGAFGIYAQEANPKATPARLGVEAQAGTDSMRLWSTTYYVKVASTPSARSSRDATVALGTAIAGALGDPGAPPRELAIFPSRGLVAGSLRYVPANILGQAGFARGFEAKYATGASTLVIVPFTGTEGARAELARYKTFLGQSGSPALSASTLCDGGVLVHDRFHGLIVAVRSGSWLAISLGDPDERTARDRLSEVCVGLAQFPSVSSRKAGSR
jgi:hypothetical protein